MKKLFATAALIIIVGLATYALASIIQQYFYPMKVTVVGNYKAEIYFGGSPYENNSLVDWGTINITESPTWAIDLTVKNTGTTPFNVSVTVETFPADWTISWSKNNTIVPPNEAASADLILTPTTTGTYNWNFIILIKEA